MTYFFSHVILNAVKNPTTRVKSTYPSLFRWDISLTLNMTYFFHVILNDSEESHDTSEKHVSPTFSVGYFAYNQYDVLFSRHKDFINFIFARQSLPLD